MDSDYQSTSEKWREQFERIKRWYQRIQEIDNTKIRISDDDLDFYYAFFINCFHLYDWMKKSNSIPIDKINNFFFKNNSMLMCRDLCLGAKHFSINKPSKGLDRLHIAREYLGKDLPEGKTKLILFQNGIHHLQDIANNCMKSLENFLRENKVL